MPRPGIDIQIDDRQVLETLNRLIQRGQDLRPVMRDISTVLMGVVRDAFDDETDPATGEKWPRLSDKTTIPRRQESGHWPGSVLQVTGRLAASISQDYGDDYAVVGTNLPYARTHQFGAKQGEFGRTSRGGPIPWGDIPARPIFGIDDEGRAEILDILAAYLKPG